MTVGEAQGRVLLIEDEELIGTLVELNLAQEGFDVEWHKLGEAARNKSYVEEFDVVLLDMHMHVMTGLETLRVLKQMDAIRPCILITSDTSEELRRNAHDADAFSILKKPVARRQLVSTVSSALVTAYQAIDGLGEPSLSTEL